MKNTPFLKSMVRETRFIETLLTGARFDESDLEHTLFHQCNLEGASFKNARNYFIDPTTNKLKGASFSLPEAISLLTNLGITLV